MKVLIAGGSGLIGRQLGRSLIADGHQIVILSRATRVNRSPGLRAAHWDGKTVTGEWLIELSGCDGVINLAGTSIGGGRWTRKRMAQILSSRLAATAALVDGIRQTREDQRPSVLISASGIDYYGNRGDEELTEQSSPGSSFLAGVCREWEAAAHGAVPLGVRVVSMRTSLVFSREALAFRLLTLPFRFFAGGPLGSGRQWFTWVHIDDIVGLYRLALARPGISGPINAVAPDIRPQREVAAEIGRVMHRPSAIPAPALALRLVLGRQAELLLDGRRARPARAEQEGYRFSYGGLHDALENTLHGQQSA